MAEKIKGYMTVKVEEASGKNKRDEYKWDSYDFEGFVKGEFGLLRPFFLGLIKMHSADLQFDLLLCPVWACSGNPWRSP